MYTLCLLVQAKNIDECFSANKVSLNVTKKQVLFFP